jgi:predicted DNA-binding transcriptional regulator AlpA
MFFECPTMNAATDVDEDVLLTTQQTARRTGFSPATLATWRCVKSEEDQPIPFVRIGRSVRYRDSIVKQIVEQGRAK